MRISLILVFLLSLTGCAINQYQTVDAIDNDDKIIVASKLGNKFRVQTTGVTAFQNEIVEIDVTEWDIPGFSERYVLSEQ